MTIQNILSHLQLINKGSVRLLQDTKYLEEGCIGDNVDHLDDECEDAFLRHKVGELLDALDGVNKDLVYLQTPHHGEHKLTRLLNGRFGYRDKDRGLQVFTSGKCLEAKIRDHFGTRRWVDTRIEHNGNDYYLAGYPNVPLEGLTVRERW